MIILLTPQLHENEFEFKNDFFRSAVRTVFVVQINGFLVSKETVELRRWESDTKI